MRSRVYFRQGDKAVLHTRTAGGTSGWVVFHDDSGNLITGITADTTARRLSFIVMESNGVSGEVGSDCARKVSPPFKWGHELRVGPFPR